LQFSWYVPLASFYHEHHPHTNHPFFSFKTRTSTPSNLINAAFQESRLNIPKAPSLGLLLEKPLFDHYNSQMSAEIANEAVERDAVLFTPYLAEIDAFKQKWIYNAISRDESVERVFGLWISVIEACLTDYAWYLNPDGLVDASRMPEDLFRKGGKGEVSTRADDILDAGDGCADTGEF
jgi:hypothetical protein